jgi:hypothetical protein
MRCTRPFGTTGSTQWHVLPEASDLDGTHGIGNLHHQGISASEPEVCAPRRAPPSPVVTGSRPDGWSSIGSRTSPPRVRRIAPMFYHRAIARCSCTRSPGGYVKPHLGQSTRGGGAAPPLPTAAPLGRLKKGEGAEGVEAEGEAHVVARAGGLPVQGRQLEDVLDVSPAPPLAPAKQVVRELRGAGRVGRSRQGVATAVPARTVRRWLWWWCAGFSCSVTWTVACDLPPLSWTA